MTLECAEEGIIVADVWWSRLAHLVESRGERKRERGRGRERERRGREAAARQTHTKTQREKGQGQAIPFEGTSQ
jgi:hypothetical protein